MTENAINILKLIHENQELSRAELSRRTGLTRPSVSTIIADLISEGIVFEISKGKSSGGKPPILLKFNPEKFGSIGIDIGFDSGINGILCDGNGDILAEEKVFLEENSITEIVNKLIVLVNKLRARCSIEVAGVGLGVAGIVDPTQNEVIASANFDLTQKNLAKLLEEEINLPVLVDNRARLAANAELIKGMAIDVEDFIYISIGSSVGSTIITNGKFLYGHSGAAGEIRNFPVHFTDNGELRVEPVEKVASETALLEQASAQFGRDISFDEFVDEFNKGNDVCKELVAKNAQYIAQITFSLSTLTDSPMVVIGGNMNEFGDFYLSALRESPTMNAMDVNHVKVGFSKFGDQSCCIGAALKVTDLAIRMKL